ncbi:MAG: hypothetical protein ACE5I2_04745 [Anaerolineae bacterium]
MHCGGGCRVIVRELNLQFGGPELDWPMPRWTMSDDDLDDLLEFLKTLD